MNFPGPHVFMVYRSNVSGILLIFKNLFKVLLIKINQMIPLVFKQK